MAIKGMEFEGKNTEEAIKAACAHFKATPDMLNIEILSTGSTGIFGLVGSKKARVKASLKEEPAARVEEEIEEHIVEESEEETTVSLEVEEAEAAGEVEEEEEEEEEPLLADEEEEEEAPYPAEMESEDAAPYEERPLTEEETAVLNTATGTLEKMISYLNGPFTIKTRVRENSVYLIIEGESSGVLIGKKGKTLDALQYLVTKVVNKQAARKIKVVVDTENYRQRHKRSLEDMARRLGEKVKRTGKPVTINPLNPADRRVIHLALQNDRGVKTRSKGEGVLKKIVILPQRGPSEPRGNTDNNH